MRTDSGYDGKRREILSVAFGIFAERGFEGTTLESVAESLGCTKPALYHYFKSKDELFASLILEALRSAGQQVKAIRSRDATGAAKIRELIRLFLDEHFERRGYFSISHRLADFKERLPPGPERDEIESLSRLIPASIVKIVSQGVEGGEFRQEDPKALGGIIFAMLSGLLVHSDAPPLAGMDRETLKASIEEIIVKGISK